LFLHDYGYNFFQLGRLTYGELNALVEAHNRREKNREKQAKKAKRMAKMRKK